LLSEETRQAIRHGRNEQTAIQKQIPHLTARFSNKQAAMARGAMGCSIAASIVRLMISANWIV